VTPGQRIYPVGGMLQEMKPGDYCIDKRDGHWKAMTPNGHFGDLSDHEVTEHEDGTITVSPSILVSFGKEVEVVDGETGKPLWHGYLKKGIWTEC